MKKLLTILLLTIVIITQAKVTEVVIGTNQLKPFVNFTVSTLDTCNIHFKGQLGVLLTPVNLPSIYVGGDFSFGNKVIQPFFGTGVNLFGYNPLYKNWTFSFKTGINIKHFSLFTGLNWYDEVIVPGLVVPVNK